MEANGVWDLWDDGAHSAAFNMAADDALLQTAEQRERPLLRVYRWDRPSVSIGCLQDVAAAPAQGFDLVRRPTGGGVVYHDHDYTYTVVIPSRHRLTRLDRLSSYRVINEAVQNAIQYIGMSAGLAQDEIPAHVDRRTMVCFQNPTRYDIVATGRKVAGSAQRRTRAGILHQGSIHFGAERPVAFDTMHEALVRSFSTTLEIRFEPFSPDPALLERIHQLETEQYARESWTRRR
jgi:lipoate-protein ligase A